MHPALLVQLVTGGKVHLKKQALDAGTKQSSQAYKSGRLTRESGMPALFWACLLCFVLNARTCSSKWILYEPIHLEQSSFLLSLWSRNFSCMESFYFDTTIEIIVYTWYTCRVLLCFALLVLLVTAARIHLKEQALDASTKQSSQAGQHNSQACLLCCGPAYLNCAHF